MQCGGVTAAEATATGVVFHDANENRKYDQGERLLEGIKVSNGREIVKTGAEGRYEVPVDGDTILFVIKPKGWRTPLNEEMLPQFYYINKPEGSRESDYPGVAPTGPLPESVDFPLYPQEEPDEFKAIFFGDPQPRNQKEVEFVYHDVVEQLIGTDASFGVSLGDLAFNNLDTLDTLNKGISLIGIPWYNVIGNHDLNFDSPTDKDSDETFHRYYGPNYYSFDYGNVHFMVLDNVNWRHVPEGRRREGRYTAGLDEKQLEFIKNDLAMIPEDQMILLMSHIPIFHTENKGDLFRMIEQRPLAVSISGHTHWQEHKFLTRGDGWEGPEPHHHIINVTVCGSWWAGEPDETGIPHATMTDGAPNGYSIMTFDGKKYDWEFVAARRPKDYQMNIYAPEVVSADASSTEVVVNVFGGSDKSTVEMQVGDDDRWTSLEKVLRRDPAMLKMKEREKVVEESGGLLNGRPLPHPREDNFHMWQGMLPDRMTTGIHMIKVRTTDMFGKKYEDQRIIRVE
jgi:hypothetical protein